MTTPERSIAGMVGLAAVVAVAVAGCGSAAKSSDTPTAAAAAIRHAADVSQAAPGYKMDMVIAMQVPAVGKERIDITGTFARPANTGRMTFTTHAQGRSVQIQEILLGKVIYEKLPQSEASQLPGGKPWLKLDFAEAPKGSSLSKLTALTGSSANEAFASIGYLKDEARSIKELGQATVDGTQTTHYQAVIDLRKAGAGRAKAVHAATQQLLQSLPGKIANETALPVDVWVDPSHLIRRMRMTMQITPKGASQPIGATETLAVSHYGAQPTPTPPPASETTDLIALLKSEGKLGELSKSL